MSDAVNSSTSNLIKLENGVGRIVADDWTWVRINKATEEVKKQAGKVVLFKLTGDATASADEIAATDIPAQGRVLLPLTVWLARKDELSARVAANEIGVWVETHELVEDLVASLPDINVLPLIAVHVERFADGRIYSAGALLRTRFGYRNELRALGDVLRDQLFFFKRTGFDAFLIRADRSAEDAIASLKDFSEPYQGAVDDKRPLWRRHARSVTA
ncbi:DUF934 domain-containing protein [Uliginosibacterium sp. H1]|uniref:DUF934 domain-containing protein n=1 Tax=Uliginosibacterium sp. H1 TaxID=3114757 RepID=UPI002E17332A|nr:DUF934 domain-containing protein [Uliginosibacterium sp. H1]